jgi:hypothetical protein
MSLSALSTSLLRVERKMDRLLWMLGPIPRFEDGNGLPRSNGAVGNRNICPLCFQTYQSFFDLQDGTVVNSCGCVFPRGIALPESPAIPKAAPIPEEKEES